MIRNIPKNSFQCFFVFFLFFFLSFLAIFFFISFTKISRNKKEVKDDGGVEYIPGNYDQETEFFENNLDIQMKAYIVVRATRDEVGSIMRANLLFSALFGYSKEEILNKKINILMPELYAVNHNDFVNRFLENTWSDQYFESKYLSVNQNFFGKNKSGFIFPMTSKVMFMKEQLLFITTFVPQMIVKTSMVLIVNKEGVILDISASVIHFLKLDLSQIRKNRMMINEFIPNILQDKEKYTSSPIPINIKVCVDNVETTNKFNCLVGNIEFCIIEQDFNGEEGGGNEETKIQKNFGFWIKLEKIDNNILAFQIGSADKPRPSSKIIKKEIKDLKLNLSYKSENLSPKSLF